MNRNVQLLVISLFIIGFPAGSWYYLNKGYNYRIKIIEELSQQLGEMPSFDFVNQNGEPINDAHRSKKIVINSFLSLSEVESHEVVMNRLYTIQDQFDKNDDILFYTYVEADTLTNVQDYVKALNIKEERQWHFLTGNMATMNTFIQHFPFPKGVAKSYTGNSTVAIADTSSMIRYFYNLNDEKQAGRLVEHIANLMPQAPPEDARLKRELEK